MIDESSFENLALGFAPMTERLSAWSLEHGYAVEKNCGRFPRLYVRRQEVPPLASSFIDIDTLRDHITPRTTVEDLHFSIHSGVYVFGQSWGRRFLNAQSVSYEKLQTRLETILSEIATRLELIDPMKENWLYDMAVLPSPL